jgi:hypothetical protein
MNQLKISFWKDSHNSIYRNLREKVEDQVNYHLLRLINRKMRIDYGNFKPL